MRQKKEKRKTINTAGRSGALHRDRRQEKGLKVLRITASVLCVTALLAAGGYVIKQNTDKLPFLEKKQESVKTEQKTKQKVKQELVFHALDDVKDAKAQITSYNTYGTSFNLNGEITLGQAEQVKRVSLVLRNAYKEPEQQKQPVITKELEYTVDGNKLSYQTAETITDGLCLEDIVTGDYCALLLVEYEDERQEYHSFTNASNEKDVQYYTLSNNHTNNEIDIDFLKENMSYLSVKSAEQALPEDVYDVVVDAGHGGADVGAVNGNYTESELVLNMALKLRDELEKAGYKVLMTRDGSEDPQERTNKTMYDKDGRVNVTMRSKAKYCLSLHLNSNIEHVNLTGVQVYATVRGNNKMAKEFADNIVTYTGTTYSGMKAYRVDEGVYNRAYTEKEIAEAAENAQSAGYEPYDMTTNTDYFYMVRETGGIATGAYIDGRNANYGKNEGVNFNQGVQDFLLELGYISENADLQNILANENDYVQAIAQTVIEQR